MKLAGRWRNVERRGPRTHIRGQLMATIADSSPLTESTLLRALIAVWVLFDAYVCRVSIACLSRVYRVFPGVYASVSTLPLSSRTRSAGS